MWNRWTREYIRSLREQHRLTGNNETSLPKVGDVVIIKEDQKPRNVWKLAMVKQLITGRDSVVSRESCEVENWKWSFRVGNPTFVSAGVKL
jgi:hypothetical protein